VYFLLLAQAPINNAERINKPGYTLRHFML
jgi:hypothetical protein